MAGLLKTAGEHLENMGVCIGSITFFCSRIPVSMSSFDSMVAICILL